MGSEIVNRQIDERSSQRIIAFSIFIVVSFALGVLNQQYLHSKLLGAAISVIEVSYVGFICFTLVICGGLLAAVPLLMNSTKASGRCFSDATMQSYTVNIFDLFISLYYPLAMYFGGHHVLAYITITIELLLIALGVWMTSYRFKFNVQ